MTTQITQANSDARTAAIDRRGRIVAGGIVISAPDNDPPADCALASYLGQACLMQQPQRGTQGGVLT